MEITYTIILHPDVVNVDILKLSSTTKERVRRAIDEKLTTFPTIYGKHLHANLAGVFKLRVGDYRVLFMVDDTAVKIIAIQHRSVVYKSPEKRLPN